MPLPFVEQAVLADCKFQTRSERRPEKKESKEGEVETRREKSKEISGRTTGRIWCGHRRSQRTDHITEKHTIDCPPPQSTTSCTGQEDSQHQAAQRRRDSGPAAFLVAATAASPQRPTTPQGVLELASCAEEEAKTQHSRENPSVPEPRSVPEGSAILDREEGETLSVTLAFSSGLATVNSGSPGSWGLKLLVLVHHGRLCI